MHELPVTQGILDVVVEAAQKAGAAQVTSVELVVGDLSSIVDDSVQFYWEIMSKGTVAEGAALHFRREPAIATCIDCSHSWHVTPPLMPECPNCESARIRVAGGKQFFVESIEVD